MYAVMDSEKASEALFAALFPKHPYHTPVIGWGDHLKNPSITNVKKYHDQWYVPNNMAVCLCGDFNPDEAIKVIDQYFGALKPNPNLQKMQFEPEDPITAPVVKDVLGLESPSLLLAWRFPGANSPEARYLELISAILSNGKAGLIDLDVNQQQKTLGMYAFNQSLADYSAFLIEAEPLQGQSLEEVKAIALAEIEKVKSGAFDEELLASILNNKKLQFMRQCENSRFMVRAEVNSFINEIPWKDFVGNIDALAKITKEDIVAFANEHFKDNYVQINKLEQRDPVDTRIAKPSITPIMMNRDVSSQFLKDLQASQVKPIDVVKGTFRFRSRKELSRIFMVIQNVISIVLIALVITMQLQMRHMVNRPVGLQTDNLYFISSKLDVIPEKTAFIDELRSLPCVKELAFTENVPGVSTTYFLMAKMGETEKDTRVASFHCDSAAFRMMGFQVIEQFHEPEATSFWMTESAVAGMTGLPRGIYNYDTIFAWKQDNIGNDVCGVIKDFNMLDALHAADEDYTIVFCNGNPLYGLGGGHPLLEIVGDHREAKRAIDAVYKKHCEKMLGTYMEPEYNDFLKNVVASKYNKTKRQMRLIELIMGISVLLSLLGLVAMSTHFASEREKSIAIRKVFGGTLESETRRNLNEYVIMILIANVIAIPLAVWLCGRYLEDFVYRIDLHPWIFVVTVLLSFVIAIGSVLWQTLRAAKTNPAEALKKE